MDNFKINADKLLYDLGLLNELNNYGTPYIVGSYAMDLMAWNDLDVYVSNESMSTEKLYELTSFILNIFTPCGMKRRTRVPMERQFGFTALKLKY